jgi:hypothetical protein
VTALEFLDAAVEVLRKAGRPMTSHEITEAALQLGLITTRGKTPRATMSARLYTYVRDNPDGPVVRVADARQTRLRPLGVAHLKAGHAFAAIRPRTAMQVVLSESTRWSSTQSQRGERDKGEAALRRRAPTSADRVAIF